MSTMTKAESVFLEALKLPAGKSIQIHLPSPAAANSFRVALYRTRTKSGNFSIAISVKENTITLSREEETFSVTILDKNGESEQKDLKLTTFEEKLENQKNFEESRFTPPTPEEIAIFNAERNETFARIKEQVLTRERARGTSDENIAIMIEKERKLLYR